MIVTLAVVGFLVLVLIYFFVRSQAVERELKQTKHQAKVVGSQAKQALVSVDVLALEIQKSLLERLDAAKKRKLIDGDNYERAKALFLRFERVIMLCSEQGLSVSEALKKVFIKSDRSFDDVCEFISELPQDVKLAWSRNDVNSFVTACSNIMKCVSNPGSNKPSNSDNNAEAAQPAKP